MPIINNNRQTINPMSKFKRIIEFILALLNFLFHFKPTPDNEAIATVETYPGPAAPPGTERDNPLFAPIP